MQKLKAALASLSLAAAVLAPAVVAAQEEGDTGHDPSEARAAPRRRASDRAVQLDIHAGFTWWGTGFVSGVRIGFPIVRDGLSSSLDDALYVNFGADAYIVGEICSGNGCRAYGFGLGFPVALEWQIDFDERWAGFVELGVNVFLHPSVWRGTNIWWHPGPWILGAVGGSLKLGEHVALTLRLGNPYSAFGVTITF